jgi:ribosomal protein L24
MYRSGYNEVKVGDRVVVNVHGVNRGKKGTVSKLRDDHETAECGGPIWIRFDDGTEHRISHRFVSIIEYVDVHTS